MPKLNTPSRGNILRAAIQIARKPGGWQSITRARIAARAGCAEGLVSYYFGSMGDLRGELMNMALKREYVALIAQGVASGHLVLNGLSESLRTKVIDHLVSR